MLRPGLARPKTGIVSPEACLETGEPPSPPFPPLPTAAAVHTDPAGPGRISARQARLGPGDPTLDQRRAAAAAALRPRGRDDPKARRRVGAQKNPARADTTGAGSGQKRPGTKR